MAILSSPNPKDPSPESRPSESAFVDSHRSSITKVTVRGEHLGLGLEGHEDVRRFAAMTFPTEAKPFIACKNPLCHHGGYALDDIVTEMARQGELQRTIALLRCSGHEGADRARQGPCWNRLKNVSVEIHRKA